MTNSWLQFILLYFSDLTLIPFFKPYCLSGMPGTQELSQEQYLTLYDIYEYLISLIFTLMMRSTVTCYWAKFQGRGSQRETKSLCRNAALNQSLQEPSMMYS